MKKIVFLKKDFEFLSIAIPLISKGFWGVELRKTWKKYGGMGGAWA